MNQKILFVIFISACWTMIFAQGKDVKSGESESIPKCKDCRLSKGTCSGIIEYLRTSQENDSLAIAIFKKEYEIVDMRHKEREWLLKKSHNEIIRYFSWKKNKEYRCRLKNFKPYDHVLLCLNDELSEFCVQENTR